MHVEGDQVAFRSWEGRPPCRPLAMCERPAELSALRASRIYCYVIFKVSADDTEVVPPYKSPRQMTMNLKKASHFNQTKFSAKRNC